MSTTTFNKQLTRPYFTCEVCDKKHTLNSMSQTIADKYNGTTVCLACVRDGGAEVRRFLKLKDQALNRTRLLFTDDFSKSKYYP